jgi:SAM-dependent methyltransferase
MRAADAAFYAAQEKYDDKWEFDVVARRLCQVGSKLRVLDIGCGDGRFIHSLQSAHDVRGVDFNEVAVKEACKKGLAVYTLSLEQYRAEFPGERYDVITLFHVLEHVSVPAEFIESLKQALVPGGLIGVSVPNPRRWTLSFIREVWDYPPHHLTRWGGDSLPSFLERHGFQIVEQAGEPVRTYRQVRSGVADIVGTFVLTHASLGIARRLAAPAQMDAGKPSAARTNAASFLSRTKSAFLAVVVSIMAAILYPLFLLRSAQGRSFLVLAKLA